MKKNDCESTYCLYVNLMEMFYSPVSSLFDVPLTSITQVTHIL